jgi:hypothetical protein
VVRETRLKAGLIPVVAAKFPVYETASWRNAAESRIAVENTLVTGGILAPFARERE